MNQADCDFFFPSVISKHNHVINELDHFELLNERV